VPAHKRFAALELRPPTRRSGPGLPERLASRRVPGGYRPRVM